MFINSINNIIYLLVFLGQVFIIISLVLFLFYRNKKYKLSIFLTKNALQISFFVALAATFGSLFYSEIAGFPPCDLCWFQRIFMYPQVLILGLAWWKKEERILDYSLILLGIGAIFAVYHNYIYYSVQITTFCSITSPCTQRYVTGFSYITIPLMALTAFLLMGILLLHKRLRPGK